MKNKFFIMLICLAMGGLYSQNESEKEIGLSPESEPIEKSRQTETYQADINLILSLIENIRDFRENSGDTQVQAEIKKRRLREKIIEINKKNKGKTISISRARLKDLTANRELSSEGEKKAKLIIQELKENTDNAPIVGNGELKDNPLLKLAVHLKLSFCDDCWQPAGDYMAEYEIPAPDHLHSTLEIILKKIFPNEESVIHMKKESIEKVTGIINSIEYESGFSEKITIEIN